MLERSGILVRVPDWWKPQRPPCLRVQVTVGCAPPRGEGADVLLDFSVRREVDGEPLSETEWRELRRQAEGLALVKGRWVEVDREAGAGAAAVEGGRASRGRRLDLVRRGDAVFGAWVAICRWRY